MKDSAKWNNNRRRGPQSSSMFPAKLFEILSNPEFSGIVRWMPHGRSWRVLKPKVFSEVVSPKYFSHQSKYASFMRQVNGWGFKRITTGPERNSYFHKLFVRDDPELMWAMSRRGSSSSKNSGGKDEADKEPNFYEITGLTKSTASRESCANISSRIPCQLHPIIATGDGGYGHHYGHGHFYDSNYKLPHGGAIIPHHHASPHSVSIEPQRYDMHGDSYYTNYDLTYEGTMDAHQYTPAQSLGPEPHYSIDPYTGGGSNNQAFGGIFPEEYSNHPPTYHAAASERPASDYLSVPFDH